MGLKQIIYCQIFSSFGFFVVVGVAAAAAVDVGGIYLFIYFCFDPFRNFKMN